MIQAWVAGHDPCWVPPFGDPRIKVCLPLPGAYRSLPRPSSTSCAKASAVRPWYLLPQSIFLLWMGNPYRCYRDRERCALASGREPLGERHRFVSCHNAMQLSRCAGREPRKPDAEKACLDRCGRTPCTRTPIIRILLFQAGELRSTPPDTVCVSLERR